MNPQGPVSKIGYAGVRIHPKGGVYDALRHTVLTCTLMAPQDRELVEGTLKTIITGAQVANLSDGKNGWLVLELTTAISHIVGPCRALLVLYKGMEVAVYFKRQLTEIKLNAGDRYPEGVLQDPQDAWQRLDLLGKSAKQANVVVLNIQQRLEKENTLLQERIRTMTYLIQKHETEEHRTEEIMKYVTEKEKNALRKRKRKGDLLEEKRHKRELAKKHKKIADEKEAKRKRRRRKRNRSKD